MVDGHRLRVGQVHSAFDAALQDQLRKLLVNGYLALGQSRVADAVGRIPPPQ